MIKNFRLLMMLLCTALIFGGGLYGCGKKADPRPTGLAVPKAISDLKATRGETGVILRWTIPDTKGGIQKYRIERSEFLAKGATCPDCPVQYATIADISFNDPKLAKEGDNGLSYLDPGVKAGYLYTYRIVACDLAGQCSQASNMADVVVDVEAPAGKDGAERK